MNPSQQVNELLQQHGAELLSGKKHRKWKLPNGQVFVVAASPSDRRAAANQLTHLKRILGLTKTETTEGERRERRVKRGGTEPKFKVKEPIVMDTLGDKLRASGAVEMQLRTELEQLRRSFDLTCEHLAANRAELCEREERYDALMQKYLKRLEHRDGYVVEYLRFLFNKRCPRCGGKASKLMYFGVPMRLCRDGDCITGWGIGTYVTQLYFDGNFIEYGGNYFIALWKWLTGQAREVVE